MPLQITVREQTKGIFTVHPEGSIDATTHRILGAQVDEILMKSPILIIFDMKDVGYISSAGIGVFLSAEKEMKQQGGQTVLLHLQPQIKKVFDIVQALPAQQIFSSVQEMDKYLAEIQRKVREGEIE